MRFTIVILAAVFCLNANAESSIDQRSDDAIIAAAEQLIAEGEANAAAEKANSSSSSDGTISLSGSNAATEASTGTANSATETSNLKLQTDNLKESDIPVFMTEKKAAKTDNSILWRLVASIFVIFAVAGGFMYAGKRWTRHKDKGGNKARIEIMHQMHLGPKRSIALIRVSGETMLVGITDHNVNMLKSVTLIDDELENIANKDFNNFLEDEFSIEDVRNALGPRV